MSSEEYPLKHIRLEQLHTSGFNIADYICFSPNTLLEHQEELRAFLEKHKQISCRHFHADELNHFKCPVLYDQTDFDEILKFCLQNNYGNNKEETPFYTLCNEAIKLADSVYAGNILVFNENTYFVEYFYGPGTPRDVEKKAPPELKIYSKTGYSPAEGEKPPVEILYLVQTARKFRALANRAYIVEFSVYPYPVGKNQTNVICWEWRWGWLHYQLEHNKRLMQAIEQLTEENRRLADEIQSLRWQVSRSKIHSGPSTLSYK